MTAVNRPRGPLPRRVYWFRRVLVLGVALALVFGIAKLLETTGGDSGIDTATPVVSTPSATPSAVDPSASPQERLTRKQRQAERKRDRLPQPTGPCAEDDVRVNPSVIGAHAGGEIEIVLEVSTAEADACTWEVSPESVFLTVAGESGVLWSSQECTDVIPVETVVARRERADRVSVTWNGKESDEGCTDSTLWVEEGLYSATAVARGSVTPLDTEFVIQGAVARTVTKTPTPTPTPTAKQR